MFQQVLAICIKKIHDGKIALYSRYLLVYETVAVGMNWWLYVQIWPCHYLEAYNFRQLI